MSRRPVESKRKKLTMEKITITVGVDGTVSPKEPQAQRHGTQSDSDKVRWKNDAHRGIAIVFTDWPFVEPPGPIEIKAGATSDWYQVYEATPIADYPYSVTPPLALGPPGEPKIEVSG
jgi:hypothetical protein